jgi:hypothetical protein
MRIVEPTAGAIFNIAPEPTWPTIAFKTDAPGSHRWEWKVSWRNFEKSGSVVTPDNHWDAGPAIVNCGGSLSVRATAGTATTTISVQLRGSNPSTLLVNQYLAAKLNSGGMVEIINHESRCRQFTAKGEPLRSFDNGYGLCQLTNPAPNIEQVWNWKLHVDMGLTVLAQKRAAAILYLSANRRTYNDSQLTYETVSRWNGGSYHEWDAAAGWVRRTDVLCDAATGNIGWNTSKAENQGKTEAELRGRDSGSYSKPGPGSSWGYYGVCYADHLLG